VHGEGIFAVRDLTMVNLGPYSGQLMFGHKAEEFLQREKSKGVMLDVVECMEVPSAFQTQEENGTIFPPYLLMPGKRKCTTDASTGPNKAGFLHKMNAAPNTEKVNTTITVNGDFLATEVRANEELLTDYGRSYWRGKRTANLGDAGEVKQNDTKERSQQPATHLPQDDNADHRTVITVATATNEARARMIEMEMVTSTQGRKRAQVTLSEKQEDMISARRMKLWIKQRQKQLAGSYTKISLGLRTALYIELQKAGLERPEIITSQGSRTEVASEQADMSIQSARIQLGWSRVSKEVNECENALKALQQQIRKDADNGAHSSARTYARSHNRKFCALGMSYVELQDRIAEFITEIAILDFGKPRSFSKQTVIHLCAGTAPLNDLQGRYNITVVNIERDEKEWHRATGIAPYTILPHEEGEQRQNLITQICQDMEIEQDEVAGVRASLNSVRHDDICIEHQTQVTRRSPNNATSKGRHCSNQENSG